ncbi:docking protein 2 [Electrophorus electricus]|uniref:docking protein 2 n=1 Tax=Electrophorus electricus TaxID=8005 RepID=UPI0015D05523|nr:docking protein 2 [Electrophorus electricus]
MEDAIRKKGILHQYQQRFGKRWRKVWAVVLANSVHSVARLELFDYRRSSVQEGRAGKKADSKKVIPLRDCIQILERERQDCPKECTSFLMETTDRLYIFAVQREELQSWIQELCRLAFPLNQAESRLVRQDSDPLRDHLPVDMKENSLYETAACTQDFQVIAVNSEAAAQCNLHGNYILTPQRDCLVLKDPKTKQVILSWPYCFIRKFGQDMLSFSFEAGRRCESGEGCFEFTTSHGNRLFSSIEDAIKNLPNLQQPGTKHASTKKHQEKKDKPITQNSQERAATREYSTVHHVPLSAAESSEKSQLDSMFKSLSLGSSEPSPKSHAQRSRSDPPSQSGVQDSVYAMVSKPQPSIPAERKPNSQGLKDRGLWTDPVVLPDYPLPEETSGKTESTDGLTVCAATEDYSAEAIYAEPDDYDSRPAWQYMANYPVPEEFWHGDEAWDTGHMQEEFHMPAPSTSADEDVLTYDNVSIRKRL